MKPRKRSAATVLKSASPPREVCPRARARSPPTPSTPINSSSAPLRRGARGRGCEHSWAATVSDHPIGFHWKALDLATFDGRDLPAPTSKAEQEARSSILTEAYLIHRLDPDGWVSYSRNKTWYSAAPRYRGSAYTYTTVTRSIDMLAAVGLLNHNKAPPGTYRQIQSTFKASPSLIAALGSAPLPVLYDPAETLLLRDRDKNLIQYRDTEETRSIRKNLAIINEALEAAAVAHPDLGEVLDGTPVRLGKVVPGPAKRTLHRSFYRELEP
jgi:hypothetical protein